MHRISYKLLLLLTIIAAAAGALSFLPRDAASYPNIIGYRSLCTFTPAAGLYCFLMAGIACFIRSTFIKDQSGTVAARFRMHIKSLIPLSIVLAAALIFTVVFANVKKQYEGGMDALSSASVQTETEQ